MRQGGLQLKPFCDFFNHHPAWMFTDGLVKETRNRVYKIRYEILWVREMSLSFQWSRNDVFTCRTLNTVIMRVSRNGVCNNNKTMKVLCPLTVGAAERCLYNFQWYINLSSYHCFFFLWWDLNLKYHFTLILPFNLCLVQMALSTVTAGCRKQIS